MVKLAPEFHHDIFVTYSQGDIDHSGNSLLRSWSLAFANELESELRLTPGLKDASVYIDGSGRSGQGINSVDPLTPQLRGAVSNSAFLLVLMSPHYVEAPWCADERSWWLNEMSTRRAV